MELNVFREIYNRLAEQERAIFKAVATSEGGLSVKDIAEDFPLKKTRVNTIVQVLFKACLVDKMSMLTNCNVVPVYFVPVPIKINAKNLKIIATEIIG